MRDWSNGGDTLPLGPIEYAREMVKLRNRAMDDLRSGFERDDPEGSQVLRDYAIEHNLKVLCLLMGWV